MKRKRTPDPLAHPVLRRFYPALCTLRHHLLSRLPAASRNRRRKLSTLGSHAQDHVDIELAQLLDSTLVGLSHHVDAADAKERDRDVDSFTQQLSQPGTYQPGYLLQPEIVDFVVWRLFKRSTSHKLSHLLCHGFQRSGSAQHRPAQHGPNSSIPGLHAAYPNTYVQALKGPLWCRLQALLGPGGDRIMMDMLLDCAIFSPVQGDSNNYYQLSGPPISDVPLAVATRPALQPSNVDKTPCAIIFVRSRILYAKAALNAKGNVRFGMRHIHVLNRFPKRHDRQQTVHIMRYLFPRQFGLHNVFTSKIDPRETAMPFKDYTLREKDIHQVMCKTLGDKSSNPEAVDRWKIHVPKRLRGEAVRLIDRLRLLHHRCSYTELLRHYCPVDGPQSLSHHQEAVDNLSFTAMACHTAHVSAFCRAAVAKVVPNDMWGSDHNKHVVMFWIDQFVSLRRFETLSLHQVTQKLQVTDVAWLRPPGQDEGVRLAKSDFDKRKEIYFEFLYWVFDSFLVPLIRSHFYVTESNTDRNRLFYFRHDVWRRLAEPSLAGLKESIFEEMPTDRITKLLAVRKLGFSKIRLLPKKQGVRLIMNLRRRQQVMRYGSMTLGRSINSVMAPVFNAITYEKSLQPDRFGGSLFSVGDMLPKLAGFRASLQKRNLQDSRLYFAKVDVQSCFDTIPQQRMLSMMDSLMSMQAYRTGKHVEISPLGALQRLNGQQVDAAPVKRYVAHGSGATGAVAFDELVKERLAGKRANTVFVDTNMQQQESKAELMLLLREHVERNVVKMGKRFYRQKTGIPQGSILSTILCNLFYAELEREVLGFTANDECLLLRLLDDFLLISTSRQHAERFVHVMHEGHAEYGVTVQASKTVTNFDVEVGGQRIAQSEGKGRFVYCGMGIDTTTLEVSKHGEALSRREVENSLTVDFTKVPGQSFHRKALNAFKIQLHAMLIDTELNSVGRIWANVHQSFRGAALRCVEYVGTLARMRRTRSDLVKRVVNSMVGLAMVMVQRRVRGGARVISRRQMQWLACKAFETVFQRRQTQHGALLAWLAASLRAARASSAAERAQLEAAAAGAARQTA